MKLKENNKSLSFILYLFSFFLLLEWIYPLKEVANTGNTSLFIIFIILSFILYLFNAPFFPVIVLKIIFISFSLHHIFFDKPIFGIEWVSILLADIVKNIGLLFARNWGELTNEFRTLLFFILLWLIMYLLRYWVIVRRNVFLFFVMTIVYITVLDTFTPYNSEFAIVRTVVFGFVLLGMLFFQRFVERENVQSTRKLMTKWMIPLSVMIIGSIFIALIAPKASPIWPDPVPYLKSYAGADNNGNKEGIGSGVKKVGYREDDSELGGPFEGDDTVVFNVVTESRQYWRMETKDLYTGKGWKTSKPDTTSSYQQYDKLPISLNEGIDSLSIKNSTAEDEKKFKSAYITMEQRSPNFVHTYGFTNILFERPSSSEKSDNDDAFLVNDTTEKITAIQYNEPFFVREYNIIYQLQRYSIKKMSQVTGENVQFDPRYIQLPEKFPKRITDLAIKLTKDKKNWYDKTKAIEGYLQSGKYKYDQKKVGIPKENQDYVDQFLFETLRGYCDNFSTSMVTMLRSIGIPSRWVKGYSSGDYQGSEGVSRNIYKVTNNNAHSWVEVFFPKVGWVPFEPTMGFINNSVFNNDLTTKSQAASTTPKEEEKVTKKPQKELDSDSEKASSDGFSFANLWKKTTQFLHDHWLFIVFSIIITSLISGLIFIKRSKWLPYILIWKYRARNDTETFSKAYLSLLKQLERFGLQKETGQTLREYARNVDDYFGTQTMHQLTEQYERNIYRGENITADWEQTRELWENLIKKTTG
ncbi:transglutaminase TgpA family protein [Heyndrickxia vini]|uniref:Transglutaminase domain-containing protein n=1 Tax=Heyndrickxia vini TaxID=1476025 RepID=A0ABX7E1K0_9BACI|nr:transglutaminaseTgpA domain-containing protein [Heyndrickxia vini]QQZ09125.1 transglutaminase domain-containing protein [Heyndrickxia vini]